MLQNESEKLLNLWKPVIFISGRQARLNNVEIQLQSCYGSGSKRFLASNGSTIGLCQTGKGMNVLAKNGNGFLKAKTTFDN